MRYVGRISNALIAVLGLVSVRSAPAQGFVNLDFDAPRQPLTPVFASRYRVSEALPGWTAYIGGQPYEYAIYNNLSLGSAFLGLQGPGSVSQPPYHGQYFLTLQASYPVGVSAGVGQTGTVPLSALSLVFYSNRPGLQVTLGGQAVPVVDFGPTGVGPYRKLAVDVSGVAGQTTELRFTVLYGDAFFDSIQFSSVAVPEPGTLALFGLGVGVLLWRGVRRNRI